MFTIICSAMCPQSRMDGYEELSEDDQEELRTALKGTEETEEETQLVLKQSHRSCLNWQSLESAKRPRKKRSPQNVLALRTAMRSVKHLRHKIYCIVTILIINVI